MVLGGLFIRGTRQVIITGSNRSNNTVILPAAWCRRNNVGKGSALPFIVTETSVMFFQDEETADEITRILLGRGRKELKWSHKKGVIV